MISDNKIPNRLINEKSPYLLQHAYNPVDWFPWGEEAFEKAKAEDKPVFLSIGYSTCHWCHVMERESFEDEEAAAILNKYYIPIKVDKEERPDIDSVYMRVCQAFTGSGGWPLTIIMTPEQKPFFAGTYFPKTAKYGKNGLTDILTAIASRWKKNKRQLSDSGENVLTFLKSESLDGQSGRENPGGTVIDGEIKILKRLFDETYGGFGGAPKFPSPHNLLFLLKNYEETKNAESLSMVEKTLIQMYKGGIFDHIGYGFSRYSTDKYWLIPHFEKMLYDNALLITAYAEAYDITKNETYKKIAEKAIHYVLTELVSPEGGFYSAEDADSDGVEGKFYAFSPGEIIFVLGEDDGKFFNAYFGFSASGNFEGLNIPNLINNKELFNDRIEALIKPVYAYRKSRARLHKDDKILASWNSLMITSLLKAYKYFGNAEYLEAAKNADTFISSNLSEGNTVFTSARCGVRSREGFLDDYAFYISAQLEFYETEYEESYLNKAVSLTEAVIDDFFDDANGGFFLYGSSGERLIIRPKDTYDGAVPSGNSVMAYNLLKLSYLTDNKKIGNAFEKHFKFMTSNASLNGGNGFFMLCLLAEKYDTKKIVCVLKDKNELRTLKKQFPKNSHVLILECPTTDYPLKNAKTTFYVCENNACLPPENQL